MIKYIALAFSAVLVGIDQLLKAQVLAKLLPVRQVEVVPGFFYLTYVENRGAAFGILQGRTGLLAILTAAVLIGAVVFMLSGRIKGNFALWSVALVVAGGFGNLIDRVFRGYVIDYLDFSALFGFPVFNFADCCVVVGTLLLLCAIVWSDGLEGKRKAEGGDLPAADSGPKEEH